MSGGLFDYQEWHITDMADSILEIIRNNRERVDDDDARRLPDDIVKSYEDAYIALKRAKVYVTRVDYLESGDDGEDSFRQRLQDDLHELDVHIKTVFPDRG